MLIKPVPDSVSGELCEARMHLLVVDLDPSVFDILGAVGRDLSLVWHA